MDKDFLQMAADRYSVRKFTDEPVKREDMEKILEAGRLAPTACNRQPQRLYVIDSEDAVEKMHRCTECHFGAKSGILICYDKNECWKRSYDGRSSGDIDASIVMTHMMMEAWELGVGSTIVMYLIPEAVKEEFNIPDSLETVALLIMGYPAEDAKPHPGHHEKKQLEDIATFI